MPELVSSTVMAVVSAAITWFFARRKTNAEAKLAELDAANTAAAFYQNLLDDAGKRLDDAIATIQKQDEKIKTLLAENEKQDVKIKKLLFEIEHLTDELRKYKQLNGKQTSNG